MSQLPDAQGRLYGRFPAWWTQIEPADLERAHSAAQVLITSGYGPALALLDADATDQQLPLLG